ncbi:hypothetical protein EIP91_001120 [Steccherinum ochraceum]|uniref:Anaphase-promoting complex subunit 2 n=1 Tax=Steccherinum ochraceum TaxID=92696 RepID=A0A4R0REN3_9APHY|nr:hypothetical protein EIP91_001120 [Steccherinum ochraceum]
MSAPPLYQQVAVQWSNAFLHLNRDEPGISGLISFAEAWRLIKDFLRPRDLSSPKRESDFNMATIRAAAEIITQCEMLLVLQDDFMDAVRIHLHLITQDIVQLMQQYEASSDAQHVAKLVARLSEWYNAWIPLEDLGESMLNAYNLAFQTHVYSVLPSSFTRGFRALVTLTFNLAQESTGAEWLFTIFPKPNNPSVRIDKPLWDAFHLLGLSERYDSLISSVCYEYVEAYIVKTCAGKWDEPKLNTIRDWMVNRIVPWMLLPFAREAKTAEDAKSMLQGVGSRLDFHVCKTLADLRTNEIFDIIVDYPDSTNALKDLKECLARVDQRSHLVQTLRKANKRRLLHPGADTKDILAQYVSIIRCLRMVDPPGVLLFKVADPIRQYLRSRPDTIRCIVASLVGDGESGDSLVDENEPIQPLQQLQAEDYSDPDWEPEPIDAGPDFRTSKPSDVISTLVSIYDSKELFVKELQVLLAQRLLTISDGNYDRERRNIEILKIRFGEAALQVCEVMLRDMTDSRRTDQHVQAQKSTVLHPTIISKHFWPALQSTVFKMPGQFKQLQEIYAKEYTTFKPDKRLLWLPHLGTVKLDVELDDRTVSADVTPLEAAFVELFSSKDTWTVTELLAEVGNVDRTAALKAISTWLNLGVLKEVAMDQYKLLNVAEADVYGSGSRLPAPAPAEDELPPVVTMQQQQAEQMQVFWKFIEGMLTNLGQLSLDRIQGMLKFAPGYDRNVDQLAVFMEAARREGLVTVRDGLWRLNK